MGHTAQDLEIVDDEKIGEYMRVELEVSSGLDTGCSRRDPLYRLLNSSA